MQVSLKVTSQIEHLNITVTFEFLGRACVSGNGPHNRCFPEHQMKYGTTVLPNVASYVPRKLRDSFSQMKAI